MICVQYFFIILFLVVRVGLEPTTIQPFLVGCDNHFPHYVLPDYLIHFKELSESEVGIEPTLSQPLQDLEPFLITLSDFPSTNIILYF
jgi:hypothetical protein